MIGLASDAFLVVIIITEYVFFWSLYWTFVGFSTFEDGMQIYGREEQLIYVNEFSLVSAFVCLV